MGRRSRQRRLSSEEQRLWAAVTKVVTPLAEHVAVPPSVDTEPQPAAPVTKTHHPTPPLSAPPKPAPKRPHRSVHDAGDPRQARRAARGKITIDATLDLHGMRQHEAEIRLHRFLTMAHTLGHRMVLVITGKGIPEADYDPFEEAPRGILRRRFLEWVDHPPLSTLITSVRVSHKRHGGNGAFYVFLRHRESKRI